MAPLLAKQVFYDSFCNHSLIALALANVGAKKGLLLGSIYPCGMSEFYYCCIRTMASL